MCSAVAVHSAPPLDPGYLSSRGAFVKLPTDLDHCDIALSKKFREVNIRLDELPFATISELTHGALFLGGR